MIATNTESIVLKRNTMRYPPHGILKASFVTCISHIHPGIVIRMPFPDLHEPHAKNYYFGVVTIVTMHLDHNGSESPAVIRVHWGDNSFNDFCFFSSADFSFDALLDYANNFAAFRNGSLKGVDALQWSLIRKFENYVQAARPCSATFRFSSPTRTRPEIVMWHFARNSSKTKLAKTICKATRSPKNRQKDQTKCNESPARELASASLAEERSANMSRAGLQPGVRHHQAKDITVSFLLQVASYVTGMRAQTMHNHK
jgi:hypothetical protein